MEGKDNRSKDKRHKMKTFYRNKSKYCKTSSSSEKQEPIRGYVDVVDSSDERFMDRNEWVKGRGQRVTTQMEYVNMDMNLEDEENEQMRAGDFHLMSQMPLSVGGHFKFSSEKQWEQAENEAFLDNTEASEYFTLNLKLINVGLQTIPFYKRMDFSSSMFTNEQLVGMEKTAELAEKTYQNVLKEHIDNPRIQISSASRKTNSAKSQKSQSSNAKKAAEAPDELDELLNMTTDQMSKASIQSGRNTPAISAPATPGTLGNATTRPPSGDNKDDIQQWLDNVLEE
ncbi:apoptosis and caspase activation inhibitor isoform X2 [Musca autumnalis]|uniref:apoptosis and caspase activation inhibitor isoform X1 n=1 Tax=Musca autumnalis TaxID=221902 RepID=UPI003CF8AD16